VFSLLSKHVKLKICRTGYRTWPPALWEEHRLRVFENRVLRMIFKHKRNELTEESSYIMRSFMICTASFMICTASFMICTASFMICTASFMICTASFMICTTPQILFR